MSDVYVVVPLSGRVTPEQLCSYVQLFKSSWGALESHCGVLQLGLATPPCHAGTPAWLSRDCWSNIHVFYTILKIKCVHSVTVSENALQRKHHK